MNLLILIVLSFATFLTSVVNAIPDTGNELTLTKMPVEIISLIADHLPDRTDIAHFLGTSRLLYRTFMSSRNGRIMKFVRDLKYDGSASLPESILKLGFVGALNYPQTMTVMGRRPAWLMQLMVYAIDHFEPPVFKRLLGAITTVAPKQDLNFTSNIEQLKAHFHDLFLARMLSFEATGSTLNVEVAKLDRSLALIGYLLLPKAPVRYDHHGDVLLTACLLPVYLRSRAIRLFQVDPDIVDFALRIAFNIHPSLVMPIISYSKESHKTPAMHLYAYLASAVTVGLNDRKTVNLKSKVAWNQVKNLVSDLRGPLTAMALDALASA